LVPKGVEKSEVLILVTTMAQSAVASAAAQKRKWHIAASPRRFAACCQQGLLPTANSVMRSVIAQWECRYL